MKNTLRLLVGWNCNLKCPYCCNEQARFRKDILPMSIDNIQWSQYDVYCISGGEPLLYPKTVVKVLEKCDKSKLIVFYTNGVLLNAEYAAMLQTNGVKAINVGLHHPNSFKRIIENVTNATANRGLMVRFHAQDIYSEQLTAQYPDVHFKFWKMDDCDRMNEDRFVLTESLDNQ